MGRSSWGSRFRAAYPWLVLLSFCGTAANYLSTSLERGSLLSPFISGSVILRALTSVPERKNENGLLLP